MSNFASASSVYANQGGGEAQIGSEFTAIPVTIDGARNNTTVTGPSLFARRTASPYDAVPFMNNTAIINPTNVTNATVDIADADAVKFKVGDLITYYDVSAGALHTETKTLDIIGAAGSGGAGETLLTMTGEVWTTAPVAGDLLVVADGAQLSANVIVVDESVAFDGATDFPSKGYVTGVFQKDKVGNTTYFDQSKNQALKLVDMQ